MMLYYCAMEQWRIEVKLRQIGSLVQNRCLDAGGSCLFHADYRQRCLFTNL